MSEDPAPVSDVWTAPPDHRLVQPRADDPLIALLERMAVEAQAAGLTEADIDAELAAYNAERRA